MCNFIMSFCRLGYCICHCGISSLCVWSKRNHLGFLYMHQKVTSLNLFDDFMPGIFSVGDVSSCTMFSSPSQSTSNIE